MDVINIMAFVGIGVIAAVYLALRRAEKSPKKA